MARRIHRTLEGVDVQHYLQRLIAQVEGHPRIRLFTETELLETTGHVGQFHQRLFFTGAKKGSVEHGAVVVATGGRNINPRNTPMAGIPGS